MPTLLRICGTAILGFMFPRILVGAGVPLDKWAIEIGIKIAGAGAMMSGGQALTILGVILALLFMTVELWLKPIGRIIEAAKRYLPWGRRYPGEYLAQGNGPTSLLPDQKRDTPSVIQSPYDAPIWKAFEHVAASINESRVGYDLPKTRSLVRQKAIDGHLKIWGKKQIGRGPKWIETLTFDDVVTEIPKQYWNISKILAYATTDNKHVNNAYTAAIAPGRWPNEKNAYADLRINLGQVKQIWP